MPSSATIVGLIYNAPGRKPTVTIPPADLLLRDAVPTHRAHSQPIAARCLTPNNIHPSTTKRAPKCWCFSAAHQKEPVYVGRNQSIRSTKSRGSNRPRKRVPALRTAPHRIHLRSRVFLVDAQTKKKSASADTHRTPQHVTHTHDRLQHEASLAAFPAFLLTRA